MSHIGTSPPSGVNESCIALTPPFERRGGSRRVQSADDETPNRTSLPSMFPPGCQRTRGLVDVERGERGVARLLLREADPEQRQEDDEHRREQRPALARVLDHLAERVSERGRYRQNRDENRRSSRAESGSRKDAPSSR